MSKVSVILPTYNEAGNIKLLVNTILQLECSLIHEILVVDDNSPDGTAAIAEELAKTNSKVKLLLRHTEKGLVNSLRDGIKAATGDCVLWMDSDLQMPPSLIPTLVKSIENGYDAAIGSRFIGHGSDERYEKGKNRFIVLVHKQLSRLMCFFFYHVLKLPVVDISSGYIAIRKNIFEQYSLKGNYGEYFLDLVIYFKNKNLKIIEHPYILERRKFGNSKTQANGYLGMFKIGLSFLKLAIKSCFKRELR